MSESKRYVHPLRRFAGKTFLRRRTTADICEEKQACLLTADSDEKRVSSLTTDVNEKSAFSSPTVLASEPASTAASTSRSRIPTPSASSRRHTCSSRLNAVFTPPTSPQKGSKIPRSTTMRPSGGFLNVAGESTTPNQDGRYPFHTTQNQRKSDGGISQRPFCDSRNQPIHCVDTADIIMPSRVTTATPSSGSRSDQPGFAGHRNHVPNFSWPLSPRMQPDRNDGGTPTMRQCANLGGPPGIVNPTTLAIHTLENVTTSHSPPVSWYRANSDMSKKSSAQTIELASSSSPSPNYGDYSFEASDETIGLALTSPIPPGGDIMYKSRTEAAQSFEFVMPERSNRSSETQDYRPFKSSSETTEDHGIEVRILPQMDEENLGALRISTAQPTEYWLGRLTALSDRFRTKATMPPSITTASTRSGIKSDRMHDDGQRIDCVFEYLHTLCSTQAAKDSLEDFKIAYKKKAPKEAGSLGQGKKPREKRSVFGRMMGIKGGAGK